MPTPNKLLAELEHKFWQSLVDQDTETALEMLHEPSLMVSPHGSLKFDHDAFRKMNEQGAMAVASFDLSKMEVEFPNDSTAIVIYRVKQVIKARDTGKRTVQEMHDTSTWIKSGDRWQCVMHTETPAAKREPPDASTPVDGSPDGRNRYEGNPVTDQ